MANDLTTTGGDPRDIADARPAMAPAHMFQNRRDLGPGAAQGAIAVESERAIAEAQAGMIVAQRFPRDENDCYARMMQACERLSFAQQAFYSYSRGGQTIEGPSIRMAEELARCWRNFDYGMLELSQHDGASEYQAFAYDKESNVRSYQNFTVNHVRDTKQGNKALTDQRDIYEVGANNGARRMRARILALLPAWYVDDAVQACKKTLAKKVADTPLADQIRGMAAYALGIGVTADMLEARLGHPLAQTQPAEIQTMRGVFTALKEGVTTIAEEFATGAGDAGKALVGEAAPDPKTPPKGKAAAQDKPANDKPAEQQQKPAQEKPTEPQQQQDKPAGGDQQQGGGAAPAAEAQEKPAEAPKAAAATEAPAQTAQAAGDAPPAGDGPKEGDMF